MFISYVQCVCKYFSWFYAGCVCNFCFQEAEFREVSYKKGQLFLLFM
jgi:hypothetical protein